MTTKSQAYRLATLTLFVGLVFCALVPQVARAQDRYDLWCTTSFGRDGDGNPLIGSGRVRDCIIIGSSGFGPTSPHYLRPESGGVAGIGTGAHLANVITSRDESNCESTDRPVVIAGGIKILPELDFAAGGETPFGLGRTYDSSGSIVGAFGHKWASTIDYGLVFDHSGTQCTALLSGPTTCSTTTVGLTKVLSRRPGGGVVHLVNSNGIWADSLGDYELIQQGGNWQLWSSSGVVETYNSGGQPLFTRDESGAGLNFSYDGGGKLISVSHTSGRAMSLTWSNQRVSSILGPDGKSYAYTYSNGVLSSVTFPDSLGNKVYHYEVSGKPLLLTGYSIGGIRKTRYSYRSDERVQSSGDEDGGHLSTFTYGASTTSVTNALGQTKQYQLSTEGKITQVSRPASAACPAGSQISQYDTTGRKVLEQDGSGNRRRYIYTAEGRLQQESVGETPTGDTSKQQVTVYVWNAAQTRIDAIREYGASVSAANFIRETILTYYPDGDSAGRARLPQTVTVHDRTPTAAPSRTTGYDYSFHANKQVYKRWVDGPLAGTVDRMTYEFDSLGNLVKVTNPLGHTVTYSNYTTLGQPGRITDANGLITDILYDAKGRMTRTTVNAPGGNRVTNYGYDAHDNLISTTDPSGRVVEASYNLAGELTQLRAASAFPLGQDPKDVRNLVYNGLGQLVHDSTLQSYLKYVIVGYQNGEPIMDWVVQSKDFNERNWTYDSGGFLSSALGNNGQNVRYAYNANGDLSTVTDSLNKVTSTTYDSHGRIKSVTAPNQGTAHFEYNPLGWLTKVTDRNGNITTYTYNGHGDVTRVTSPDSGITDYTYSLAGKVLTMTRADGTVTTYTRDGLGRVTQESATWAAYNGIGGAQTHTLTYDSCTMGKGRLCGMTDSTGSTSYTYLKSGELASQTSVIGGVSFGLTFTYDAYGRLSTATYPNGVVLRYTYSSDHRVKRIEAQIAGVWKDVINNAAYQPFGGPLIGFVHGNGWNRQIDYDLDGRVTKIYGAGTTHPQNLIYGYNANDLITGITNTKNAAASQTYGYDVMSALTSANATATGQHTWQYDANGNRLSHAWGGGTDTYTKVPGTNRLASMSGPRSRSATYDPMGNLRNETRGGVTVERRYDGFNRQVKLIRPSIQSFAQPNGSTLNLPAGAWDYGYNALGQRVSKALAGGNITRYLFSPGSLLLGETNVGSSNLDTMYIWLEGNPVGIIRGGQLYAVHTDHLGRPEVATNSTKAVVWRANNLAFDRNVTVDTFGGLTLGFPGQQYDYEAGTWYNYFRHYDASVGSYQASDPIGILGGLNGYAYAAENPVTRIDPLGLSDFEHTRYYNLPTIIEHLSWLHGIQGDDLMTSPHSAAERAMIARLAAGRSEAEDFAFAHHESAEAAKCADVMRDQRAGLITVEEALARQNQAHLEVLAEQGNSTRDLYHWSAWSVQIITYALRYGGLP